MAANFIFIMVIPNNYGEELNWKLDQNNKTKKPKISILYDKVLSKQRVQL